MIGTFASAAAVAALFAPSSVTAAPPSCAGATVVTTPGAPVTLNLTCSDIGSTPTPTFVVAPFGGTAPVAWPIVYTPAPGFSGLDHLAFTVKNNDTLESSGQITVNLVVDTRPSCADATATTTVATPVTIATATLPCADADGQSLLIHAGDGAHGTVDQDPGDGGVTYTPDAGYIGTDEFEYYASDGVLQSAARVIKVAIAAPVDPTPTPTPTPEATATATPAPVTTATPSPPADKIAPTAKLKAGTASIAKGVALTVTSDEAGTAKLTLTTGSNKTTKSFKVIKGATKVTIKLSAKARKALKKSRKAKATVTIVITDAAGNSTTKKLAVTLRR